MATATSTPDVTTVDNVVVTTDIEGDTTKSDQHPYGKASTTIIHDGTASTQSNRWRLALSIDTSILEDDAADGAGVKSAIADIIAHFNAVQTQLTAPTPNA